MSKIQAYFQNNGPDHLGRYYNDSLKQTDEQLEECHDYIQWWFPLCERSSFCIEAPLLTKDDILVFQKLIDITPSVNRFCKFLGFEINWLDNKLYTLPNQCDEKWTGRFNHNHLRISRMLKCVALLGIPQTGERLCKMMMNYARTRPNYHEDSLRWWAYETLRGEIQREEIKDNK